MQPGTVLVHYTDRKETCIVNDDRTVKFRGDVMSIGRSAGIVLKENGRSDSVAGTDYWGLEKDGKWSCLSELRDETEKAKLNGQVSNTATVPESE